MHGHSQEGSSKVSFQYPPTNLCLADILDNALHVVSEEHLK
jgi:hypothetical protein